MKKLLPLNTSIETFSSLKSFIGKKWLHEFSTFFRKNAEYADQKGTMDGVPISCLIKSIQMNVLSPHWRKLRSFYERRLLPCQRWCWQTSKNGLSLQKLFFKKTSVKLASTFRRDLLTSKSSLLPSNLFCSTFYSAMMSLLNSALFSIAQNYF